MWAAERVAPEHPGRVQVAGVRELAGDLRDRVGAGEALADPADLEGTRGSRGGGDLGGWRGGGRSGGRRGFSRIGPAAGPGGGGFSAIRSARAAGGLPSPPWVGRARVNTLEPPEPSEHAALTSPLPQPAAPRRRSSGTRCTGRGSPRAPRGSRRRSARGCARA